MAEAKRSPIMETIPTYEEFRKDLDSLKFKTIVRENYQSLDIRKDTDDIVKELSGLAISKSKIIVTIEDHDRKSGM